MTNITFTDAVLLGKMYVNPRPYTIGGCLFTMARHALGLKPSQREYDQVADIFPWLKRESDNLPCGCDPLSRSVGYGARAMDKLIHIYDHHYFGDRSYSWERLVKLIQEWDPKTGARRERHNNENGRSKVSSTAIHAGQLHR